MNKPLIILEMANNHMGDVNHGLLMITKFSYICKKYLDNFNFAWKFQFRDIDTFIHKSYKDNLEHKYVKRFIETNLKHEDFIVLNNYAKEQGFKTICTGFDENSIDLIDDMKFDIVKVASCSSTDWPLLNKIVEKINKPIIISTAGIALDEIDRVVSFMQHRKKTISLMHCVGEYPTNYQNLQLNQIDILKTRYPNIPIGYSTHEEPTEYEAIQMAIAKGISIAEKHIAVVTPKYSCNSYSATPEQMDNWLSSASRALEICGIHTKKHASDKELSDLLQFKRGVFAKNQILKNAIITKDNLYYAWPSMTGQVLANHCSKYNQFVATEDIGADQPIMLNQISTTNTREKIWEIVQNIKNFLAKTGVVYPGKAELEISHHYGLDKFYDTGITMITVVNREYCKKLIIVLPNQSHPEQYHMQKEETFLVLYGDVELALNNKKQTLTKGDIITIEKNIKHSFTTETGCVIEEVSSTHYIDDSYYTDPTILANKNRKTFVTYWL